MVGAARFELATPGPPDRCANRAAPRSDMKPAPVLLPGLTGARYVLADGGYDANTLRKMLRSVSVVPVIPGRRNRKRAITYDTRQYRDRHLIESAFCRLKGFRRVATCYQKPARTFLSTAALAIRVAFWLRSLNRVQKPCPMYRQPIGCQPSVRRHPRWCSEQSLQLFLTFH